jgi:hypothetical protein
MKTQESSVTLTAPHALRYGRVFVSTRGVSDCQFVSSTHEFLFSPSKATCVTDVSIVNPNVFFRCGLVIDRDENA